MPRINKEKSNEIQTKYNQEFESHLAKLGVSDLTNDFKVILKNILSQKKHPKYYIALEILRNIRNHNLRNKDISTHIFHSIVKLKEIGVSTDTIIKIINLLFSQEFNYYNIESKISSLGNIMIIGKKWYHQYKRNKCLNYGIGGDCIDLSKYFYKKFTESKLLEDIIKESGLESRLQIAVGSSRTHFNSSDHTHIFIKLDIGNQSFIIDPSLGEISLYENSKYQIREIIDSNIYELPNFGIGALHYKILKNNRIHFELERENYSGMGLGFMDGTNIYVQLSLVKRNNDDIIPLILTLEKNGTTNNYFLLKKGKIISTNKSTLRPSQEEKVKEILVNISKRISHNPTILQICKRIMQNYIQYGVNIYKSVVNQ